MNGKLTIADLESQLAARDATIAEQAEALEGYRELIVATGLEDLSYGMAAEYDEGSLKRFLPAHEIAALRERGVEVGEVDGGNDR